jgi:hypothetical protein
MIPVEIIPGMGEGEIKENGGRAEFKYDIIQYIIRIFVNASMYQYNNKKSIFIFAYKVHLLNFLFLLSLSHM